MATGIDHNRLSLLMAVLEEGELFTSTTRCLYKVAGGVKLTEPAVDLKYYCCDSFQALRIKR